MVGRDLSNEGRSREEKKKKKKVRQRKCERWRRRDVRVNIFCILSLSREIEVPG